MADNPPFRHRLANPGIAALLATGGAALLLDRGEFGPGTVFHTAGVILVAAGLLLSLLADGAADRMRLDVVEKVMLAALAWLLIALLRHPVPFLGLHQTLSWMTLPMGYVALRRSIGGVGTWNLVWCGVCTVTLGLVFMSGYELFVLNRVPRALFLNQNSLAAWMTMVALVNAGLTAGLALRGRSGAAAAMGTLGMAATVIAISIASRGALVALLVSSALLLTLLARPRVTPQGRRYLAAGLGALILAIVLGVAISPRPAVERMADFVGHPLMAAGSRLLIWDSGLRLAADCAPWGCGAGLFWLLFTGYKRPADNSAGFHAHLDPLEIFVELGWPGLLLLLALVAAIAIRARQAWLASANDPAGLARLAGCGAALLAFMIHGLVTFNLYVAGLVALAGIIAGGIGLAPPERRATHPLSPGARFAAVGLVALTGTYLMATAYGARQYNQAITRADAMPISTLRAKLERARQFSPGADVVLVARSDLELRALESLLRTPGTPAAELTNQYDLARYFIDRAVRANPFRPDGYEFQGRLQLMDWRKPGPDRVEAAIERYEQALQRDPRRPDIREQLAQMMLSMGRYAQAAAIFADGVAWARTSSDQLRFGIQALRAYLEAGDHDAARALRDTIIAAAENERLRGNELGDIAGMTDALLNQAPP